MVTIGNQKKGVDRWGVDQRIYGISLGGVSVPPLFGEEGEMGWAGRRCKRITRLIMKILSHHTMRGGLRPPHTKWGLRPHLVIHCVV